MTLYLPLSQALDKMWSRAPLCEPASRSNVEDPSSRRPTRSSLHCWMTVKPKGEAIGWSRNICVFSVPVPQVKDTVSQCLIAECKMKWVGGCSVGNWVSLPGQYYALIAGNVLSIAQRGSYEHFSWFCCFAFGIPDGRCPQKLSAEMTPPDSDRVSRV